MTALSDLRAAVARANEVLGCGVKTCFVKPGRGYGRCRCLTDGMAEGVIPALYKSAKALVADEEPRERWVDAQANLASAIGLDNTLKTCWCYECLDEPSMGLLNPTMVRTITCPQCGNKRCPRATSHDNACSGSNEPGQDGSEK